LTFKITVHRHAQKQIFGLDREVQLKIVRAIDGLAENPRPRGCKKLQEADLWRIRLGEYRIVYFIDNKVRQLIVLKVARRREDTYHDL
jgi:mRNA interferase RelE/StbE